ncbi:MAG TPA: glycosyltransferase family 39 protein [Bacteroidota bacterium]
MSNDRYHTTMPTTPFTRLLLFLAVLLFLVVGFVALGNVVLLTPDSARYLAWAKSLAFFEGLRDDTGVEVSRYVVRPPLYPLLLAPVARFFPYNLVAAKAITLLLGVGAVILLYRLLRARMGSFIAAVGTVLFCFNPFVVLFSTQVLSEIPFILCVIASVLFMQQLAARNERTRLLEVGLLGSIVAALSLREAGLWLVPAAAIFFLMRREKNRALWVIAVPLLVYGVWVVRNELFVAGSEQSATTNVNVLVARLYTSDDASMLEELRLRVWNNFTIYGGAVGKLLVLSGTLRMTGSFVGGNDPVHQFLSGTGWLASLALQIFTMIFFFYGLYRSWKNSDPLVFPTVVFLVVYSGSLLLFPVYDVRYLFPLLPALLLYAYSGIVLFLQRVSDVGDTPQLRARALLVVILISLPNLSWVVAFTGNHVRYRSEHAKNFADAETSAQLPAIYRRSLDLAGAWVARHAEPTAVVATRWKELYLWLNGRKVLDVAPENSITALEDLVRDYNVRYFVSVVEGGLRDFELHLALAKTFSPRTVYRVGNVEVIELVPKPFLLPGKTGVVPVPQHSALQDREDERALRSDFQLGVANLRDLNTAVAESLFQHVVERSGNHSLAVLCLGITREFQGRYEEAHQLFDSFHLLPQAGSLLQQASYHREIMAKLASAESHPVMFVRAGLLREVAMSYRELGFHRRAEQTLRRSLEIEPSYFPSLIVGAMYAWEDGDVAQARLLVERAQSLKPNDAQAKGLAQVLFYTDSLRSMKDSTRSAHMQIAIARELAGIGAPEKAIGVLTGSLYEDENQQEVLRLLSELYVSKRRLAPAKRVLSRLLTINPQDVSARMAYESLEIEDE